MKQRTVVIEWPDLKTALAAHDTPGYQATEVGFQDLLYSGAGSASGSPNIATGTGSQSAVVGRSFAQGAIQNTGRSLDVAPAGARRRHVDVDRPDL